MTLGEKGGFRSNSRKMLIKSFKEDNNNNGSSVFYTRSSSDYTRLVRLRAFIKNKDFVTK
tara:strand:- start:563 stop:742 length:180 start_codon:yes stop_codon:yes gene_type:complete